MYKPISAGCFWTDFTNVNADFILIKFQITAAPFIFSPYKLTEGFPFIDIVSFIMI